jgi:hypothetical protein
MGFYFSKASDVSILYIHIPKAGGGSIEEFLEKNRFKRTIWTAKPWKFSKCSAQHMHAELLNTFLHLEKIDYIFATIRNPVHRMISEYKWRIKRDIASNGFNDWYEEARKNYQADNFYADNHMRPMHQFITSECIVFKLEDGFSSIPLSIEKALSKKKKEFQFSCKNIQNQKKELHQQRMLEEPKLITRYKSIKPSEKTVSMIIDDYIADFEIFNYSTDLQTYL